MLTFSVVCVLVGFFLGFINNAFFDIRYYYQYDTAGIAKIQVGEGNV